MELNFQKIFLIVAIAILLLWLIVISYGLINGVIQPGWPPPIAPCPDYWDVSGSYCINTTGNNKGDETTFNYDPPRDDLYNSLSPSCSTDGKTCVIPISGMTEGNMRFGIRTIETHLNWAKDNNIIWDGVFNG